MKESKLLPCYSVSLRDYLTSQGIRYELVGLHPTSKAMFWVYIKNETLDDFENLILGDYKSIYEKE